MTQLVPVEVSADSLATLLLLDKEMERLPEPIRMQPSVVAIVDFEAYKAFCDRYLAQADYLSTPTKTLKQLLAKDHTLGLLRAYYFDMSFAVCKELHYAEKYKRDATRVTHFIGDTPTVLTLSDISRTYTRVRPDTENALRTYMEARDFPLPRSFRAGNLSMWEYANVLYFYALTSPIKWALEL